MTHSFNEVDYMNGRNLSDIEKHTIACEVDEIIGYHCAKVNNIVNQNPFEGLDPQQIIDLQENVMKLYNNNGLVFSVYEILLDYLEAEFKQKVYRNGINEKNMIDSK